MTIKTTPWDSAEFLDSEEAIEAYLEAARKAGDEVLLALAMKNADRARERLKNHVYLGDRIDNWFAGMELALLLSAIAVALLIAAYSPDGFWPGLWETLKQLNAYH
ncbi:hypothetical protein P9272_11785 [Mesorhizobium sp. WSM4976]|uniref:helix-turn-helix domain-containing transcriptional regulator n=1 Tax=Mesorhizobium sp. WSM4976 TaxID=3038549 RepID=UPI002415ABE9|nr:hypothetical protein [Mesorhizobium sp. WSM4976]MDG4894249.1 hypothetical protein [Mesorhizobium sp. WSM4976]